MQHFVALKEAELDRPIYRIISFERLVEFFSSSKLVLAHPTKWNDPFETHVIGATFRIGDATTDRRHRRVAHGQCWTKKSASDAMWRIYSPGANCVRIATTPRKLGSALDLALTKLPRSRWYLGKVTYLAQKDLVGRASELATAMLKDTSDRAAAESLLFKRNSFSHEAEVRALVFDRHGRAKSGLLSLSVDPYQIIDSIQIDSRTPASLIAVYKSHLREHSDFAGPITRSTLYDPPPDLLVELSKR